MMQEGESAQGCVNPVVRIGDTVLRPVHRWTPAVHSLLRYLEAVGCSGVPRVLGFDKLGREVLSFIPGEVAQRPWPEVMLEEEGLAEVVRFLARYHNSDLQLEEYRRTETLGRQGLHPWSIFYQRGGSCGSGRREHVAERELRFACRIDVAGTSSGTSVCASQPFWRPGQWQPASQVRKP